MFPAAWGKTKLREEKFLCDLAFLCDIMSSSLGNVPILKPRNLGSNCAVIHLQLMWTHQRTKQTPNGADRTSVSWYAEVKVWCYGRFTVSTVHPWYNASARLRCSPCSAALIGVSNCSCPWRWLKHLTRNIWLMITFAQSSEDFLNSESVPRQWSTSIWLGWVNECIANRQTVLQLVPIHSLDSHFKSDDI